VDAKYLTCTLRRCGALGEGRVRDVAVESSRPTLLSRIMRLRLTYDGAVAGPASLVLKTGLADRAAELADLGRREVEFYTAVAGAMSARLVPRCFEAVWEGEAKTWHLLLEDLTDSHFVATKWPLPPTLEQCRRIVHALARFHAAWWDDSRLGVAIGRWLDADDMKTYLHRSGRRPPLRRTAGSLRAVSRRSTAPPSALPLASQSLRRPRRRPCLELSPAAGRRRRHQAFRLGRLAPRRGLE